MTKPRIRMPWERERYVTDMGDNPMCTDQSQGNDTDVNRIVARFARTGEFPQPTQPCQYGDVTGLQDDLTEIIQRGKDAQEELQQLQNEQREQQQQQQKQREERLTELEALYAQTPPTEESPSS